MSRIPPVAPQPSAVAAFLRGVDRRARLLALVQTGDAAAARNALAVAAKVFASDAGQWPIAQWPMQYWRLLLSVPAMGQRRADGDRGDMLPEIARLTPSLRAAVLLHLIAGLEDADAAAALGLGVADYQQRIRSSLPHNAQGDLDLEVWRSWRDAAQRVLAQLPDAVDAVQSPSLPPRAIVAETAARGSNRAREERAATATPTPSPHRRVRRGWWLVAVLAAALVVIAAAAAWALLHPRGRALLDAWRGRVHSEALPPAAAPKARFDPNNAALDPDRELRDHPADLALARRLPLLAWLAASGEPQATEPEAVASPISPPEAASTPPTATPAQRSRDRGAWAEWQTLTAEERHTLRAVATRFDALPPARQRALIATYAAQSWDAHRGWHLGPALGRDWPRIAALFTFIEADQRQPLLALLRQATPEEIDTLSRLAQSTPPQARDVLRRDLLAQPPDQRGAWLQARLAR
ncbi:hypothetical protein [Thermomonas sp.]|uniref:hypothetical protein n=1 Tax=Thermomonas sp. TaxID=1971895 RepID=UPI00261A94BE|nr:hypothetical protein [Thermomonas sp.]MCO5055349.1 hypothetical protein [Thermomonas sp.]